MTSPSSVVNVFIGEKGRQYYQVAPGDAFYDINFPINIALECSAVNSYVGPHHCNNCRKFGSYNNITFLLCLNCDEACNRQNKPERCACDYLQCEIDAQLHNFNADSDGGFMCLGCEFGSKCNINLWYPDVDFTTVSLSCEHYELVSYIEFMRQNNYDDNEVQNQVEFGEIVDLYVSDVDLDTSSTTDECISSVDCLSSSSTEDNISIFSTDDGAIDLTTDVCDMTFYYDDELLKQYPLIKTELQVAAQRRDLEDAQFDEYDYLQWHYERLNQEYPQF